MERMQPGQTFDVPRTALLLTGSVKSLLPLPASFSLAVNNPRRSTSAADLLWPANIGSSDSGSTAPGSQHHHQHQQGRLGTVSTASYMRHKPAAGSDDGLERQRSAPVQLQVGGSAAGSQILPPAQQQQQQQQGAEEAAGGIGRQGSSSTATSLSSGAIIAAIGAANGDDGGAAGASVNASTGSLAGSSGSGNHLAITMSSIAPGAAGGAGSDIDKQPLLAAPAELPPGHFECVIEAMVLQVRMWHQQGCCECTLVRNVEHAFRELP